MSLSTLFACLLTALVTAYATTWFLNSNSIEHPVVTVPPLLIEHEAGTLMAIGGWATTHGYSHPGRSAVEIRCYRDLQLCTEAFANVHHHDEGADLEAETPIRRDRLDGQTPAGHLQHGRRLPGAPPRTLLGLARRHAGVGAHRRLRGGQHRHRRADRRRGAIRVETTALHGEAAGSTGH